MSRHEREIPEFVFDNLDNLKEAALAHGHTLKTLGEAIGMQPTYISHLATGVFTPSKDSYEKIASVLGWKEWR